MLNCWPVFWLNQIRWRTVEQEPRITSKICQITLMYQHKYKSILSSSIYIYIYLYFYLLYMQHVSIYLSIILYSIFWSVHLNYLFICVSVFFIFSAHIYIHLYLYFYISIYPPIFYISIYIYISSINLIFFKIQFFSKFNFFLQN